MSKIHGKSMVFLIKEADAKRRRSYIPTNRVRQNQCR
jgi:hypothetical protein